MQTLNAGYRGLSCLIDVNWDRILYFFMIVAALWLGSLIGTVL